MSDPVLPPPRLVISKMVLHDFKSYAGTKEIGPFHQNFSSVVGPNGSGKSNVIDALLFVLGRRANQIRLKKLSELIHKSTNFPNLQECRVDIHFCEIIDDARAHEGFTVVPNSEFTISRIADSESKSTYKMNNRTTQIKDVLEKLSSKGMDLDNNRFLILQGEVEQIALMKPKALTPQESGLLEYFEDIIGTNRYVLEIERLFTLVEQKNEERQGHLNRVKIVEKEKDALEGPKLEAEEYNRLENDLQVTQVQIAQIDRVAAQAQAEEFLEEKKVLDEEKAALAAKMGNCTKDAKAFEGEVIANQAQYDEISAQTNKAKLDFGVFERKYAKVLEDIKHKQKNLAKATKKLNETQVKVAELEKQIETDAVNLPKCEKKLEKLSSDKEKEESIIHEKEKELMKISEPFKVEIENLQKSLIPLQAETNSCQQAVDITKKEMDIYSDKLQTGEKKYNEVKAALVKNQQEATKIEAEAKANEKKLKEKTAEKHKVDQELEVVMTQDVEHMQKRSKLLQQLEEAKNAQSSSAGTSKVLTSLMQAKKKKLLPGIFGRLGDLGTIDSKYDIAITTGVGALSMVLVDNSATGTKAISYLKTNNIGRGTFLALDKQNFPADRLQKKTDTPEGVPRLFDLIEPKEEQFKQAFYFACRETLIAKDLEQATRIAYGKERYRVITLDGKVIDTAGTMSGGGAEVRKGGMASKSSSTSASSCSSSSGEEGVLSTEFDIPKAEAALKQTEAMLGALRDEKKSLEKKAKELEAEVTELETTFNRNRSQLKELQTNQAEYKVRCAQLEKALSLSPEELASLKALEAQHTQQLLALSTAKKAAKAISEKVDKLQTKIMERGGEALEQSKQRLSQFNKEYEALEEEINRMQVLQQTGAKKINKLNAEVEECKREICTLEEQIKGLQADEEQMLDKAEKVKKDMDASEACLKQVSEELAQIQAKFEHVKTELQTLRSQKVDLDEKEKDFNKKTKEVNARVTYAEKTIDRLVKAINKDILQRKKELDLDVPMEEEKKSDTVDSTTDFEGAYKLLSNDEIALLDRAVLKKQEELKQEALNSKKPNLAAIRAFLTKEKEYNARVAALDAITVERDNARKDHEVLRKKRLDEFMAGFSVITMKLKEMYQMLTLGGDAELELVDSLDPFSEGIVFSVRPPKKSWKNITNLSGGEKTLSSLALVFALHHYKPTPLYVMDEIDAALDFKNVSIVANYIKERTKNAQFIIISLRNNMFELADRLVGIYKTNNQTKSITIDPKLFAEPIQVQQRKETIEEEKEEKSQLRA